MPRITRSGRASMTGLTQRDNPQASPAKKKSHRTSRRERIKQEPGTDEKHVHNPPEDQDNSETQDSTPSLTRKRKHTAVPKDEVVLKKEPEEVEDATPAPKKRNTKSLPKSSTTSRPSKSTAGRTKSKPEGPSEKDLAAGAEMAASFVNNPAAASPERVAKNPYGLAPGVSPYPTYAHPTPAECQQVNDILQSVHGPITAPKTIPAPSLNSSGCGEVPSVLDALIRTRLSAATNNANSSRAFRGLVEKFGILKSGVGKGSVDWDAVRRAPQRDVFEAIKTGGLADVKSRSIQQILDMVWQENKARAQALQEGKSASASDEQPESAAEREREVARINDGVLSLDHLHLLSSEAAFQQLITYPGIGPKTASCVLLFCMQRPSFAVDTHVFRLTKWLGWVPTDAQARSMAKARARDEGLKRVVGGQVTREMAYAHLDVRVPDELKYALHYLLIQHGRKCGWCSAKAGAAARVGVCPLAGLMKGKGRNKGLAKKGALGSDVDDGVTDADDEDDVKDEDDESVEDEENDEGDDDDVPVQVKVKDEQDEEMHGIQVKSTPRARRSAR